MRKILIASLVAPTLLFAQTAGPGLKPGLWEVRVVKQVVDGRDISAQLSQADRQMRQAMQSMPPEQRARMEAMLGQHGMSTGAGGGYRICLTPQMAKRDTPIIDRDGHCRMSQVTHSGSRTSFSFSCRSGGTTTTGTGVASMSADWVSTRTDATTRDAKGGTHTMQVESEMNFVNADCGDVKPLGQGK